MFINQKFIEEKKKQPQQSLPVISLSTTPSNIASPTNPTIPSQSTKRSSTTANREMNLHQKEEKTSEH